MVASKSPNAVDPKKLDQALGERMSRVPEFRFMRELAPSLGIRIYLFGGTAAGYAHYVRWDLLRERGDARFQADRFDYDFTNIYRSNQDLDIVVDGSKEAILKLEQRLREAFPHFQGEKEAWEVRSLRDDLGPTKMALLNNPDFINQNSDSNSTGLIEVTPTKLGTVRDLFQWDHPLPPCLEDFAAGKIRYYDNPKHEKTERARSGDNPKILSVIRYLAKVTQFDLEVSPGMLLGLKEIIKNYDVKKETRRYVLRKIQEFGTKIIQNAVNIESALQLIEEVGLKEKLSPISDKRLVGSLSWWMNKEALPSLPVGRGQGATAASLGITVVAHETSSFLAYESITRAHTGEPNVLKSRAGFPGEAAQHGDGFYTKTGREGAAGTGITIRFEVAPNAREGTDFQRGPHGYVIFHNKKALRVIQESLKMGPLEYLEFIKASPEYFRRLSRALDRSPAA